MPLSIDVTNMMADPLARGPGITAEEWPRSASVGRTPLPAVGATDQHTQVQLFMEGPRDKTVTFTAVEGWAGDGLIPARHPEPPELGELGGRTLGRLLEVERQATAGALMATAYGGDFTEVNAFDQPGVELGKQFAYAMLGRPGSEAARTDWDALPQPDPRWRV